MSIPGGDYILGIRLDAPSLGYAGLNGSAYTQTTFKGGPITTFVTLDQSAPDIAPSDFTLTATGTAAGRITGVVAAVDPNDPGANTYAVTIDDVTGNGSLTLGTADPAVSNNLPQFPSLTIDTTPPQLLSTVADTPAGRYGAGAGLAFAVHFSERVRPSAIPPTLTLSDGTTAAYAGGSGTSTLLFTRAVAPGEVGTDVVPTGFAANGAQILDVAGNPADLSNLHASVAGIDVDGGAARPPTIAAISATVSSGATAAAVGDTITYRIALTAPIDVLLPPDATPPSLVLSDGSHASYSGEDTNGALLFTRTIAATDAPGALSVTGFDPGTGHLVTPPSVGFSSPQTIAAGSRTIAVAAADLNGDGQSDLISASLGTAGVSVALGTGNGAFAAPVSYATVARPQALAIADVNGDGIPDIVAASNFELSVLLGTGNGTFKPSIDTSLPLSGLFNVSVVDLKGDGHPEIVLDGTQPIVKQGTNGSSFSDVYTYTALDVLRWDAGSGTFATDPAFSTAPVAGGYHASLVDVNLDGRLDVAGPTYNAEFPFQYQPPTSITFNDPVTGAPVLAQTGAVNAEPPDTISITYAIDALANQGGTAGGHSPWNSGDGAIYQSNEAYTVPSVSTTAILSDGETPYVISAGQDTLNIIDPGETSYLSCIFQTGVDIPVAIETADINGDGRPDILVGGFSAGSGGSLKPVVSVFLNYGDPHGRVVSAGTFDVPGMGFSQLRDANSFTLADVNGDGRPDLVMALSGGGVAVALNQSTPSQALDTSGLAGALAQQTQVTIGGGSPAGPPAPAPTPVIPTPTPPPVPTPTPIPPVPAAPTPGGGGSATDPTPTLPPPGSDPAPAPTPAPPAGPSTITYPVTSRLYSSVTDSYDASGHLTSRTCYGANGGVVLDVTYSTLPDGSSVATNEGGSYFRRKPFTAFTDFTAPDGTAYEEDVAYRDGHRTAQGLVPGVTLSSESDDTFFTTGGGNTFVFDPGFGQDIVTHFVLAGPHHDTISLPDGAEARLGAILARATTDAAGDMTLHLDRNDAITIQGVTAAELSRHRADFSFHG